MKNQSLLFAYVAISVSVILSDPALSKTAKDCTAEWRADKVGMQSRGVTEKSYVEQCKASETTPAASVPSQKPTAAAPPNALKQTGTSTSGKTAKDCVAEWRADKAGMQARGTTEKAYVDQCRNGSNTPTAATPASRPSVTAPAAAPAQSTTSSQKTAKDCIAEWRADKAGMQARGTTQKAYVESCRAGGVTPTAAAPEPKPTAAPAPAPKQTAPTATQAAPVPAQKPSPTTTATPARPPSSNSNGPTLEAGQFADEAPAKARCPTDTVVWVNLKSKIYHFAGTKSYGSTERGAYMCEKDAMAAENRASKTEKHP